MQLAKIIGPLFLLTGIAIFANKKFFIDIGKKIDKSPVAIMGISFIEFILGVWIILNHNTWTTAPEVIISVIGWGAALEAIILMLMTKRYTKMIIRCLKPAALPFFGILMLVVGLYLAWFAYFA